jgi:predicted dehydrogenase
MNKSVQALYERLKSGDYGQVLGIRGDVAWKRDKAYYDAAPWRGSKALAGNGVLLNQAIHTLDLLLYLAQSDCVSVSGWTGKVFDNGADAEDSAVARLGFANGAEGLFTATLANFRDAPVLVDVQTEKALFRIYNDALYEGDRELAKNDAIPVQASGKAVYGMGHLPLIARFYAALENNTADYIHPRDALPVMRVIDAIEA